MPNPLPPCALGRVEFKGPGTKKRGVNCVALLLPLFLRGWGDIPDPASALEDGRAGADGEPGFRTVSCSCFLSRRVEGLLLAGRQDLKTTCGSSCHSSSYSNENTLRKPEPRHISVRWCCQMILPCAPNMRSAGHPSFSAQCDDANLPRPVFVQPKLESRNNCTEELPQVSSSPCTSLRVVSSTTPPMVPQTLSTFIR